MTKVYKKKDKVTAPSGKPIEDMTKQELLSLALDIPDLKGVWKMDRGELEVTVKKFHGNSGKAIEIKPNGDSAVLIEIAKLRETVDSFTLAVLNKPLKVDAVDEFLAHLSGNGSSNNILKEISKLRKSITKFTQTVLGKETGKDIASTVGKINPALLEQLARSTSWSCGSDCCKECTAAEQKKCFKHYKDQFPDAFQEIFGEAIKKQAGVNVNGNDDTILVVDEDANASVVDLAGIRKHKGGAV